MLEKPDLPDAAIAETLSDRYGLAVTALEFLVAALQAYVFAILTCIYLSDAAHAADH